MPKKHKRILGSFYFFSFLVGSLRGSIIDDHLRRLLQFPVASAHKSMQHVWGEVEKKRKTRKERKHNVEIL